MDILKSLLAEYGLWIVLLGTFFEGETVVIVAGFAAHQGLFNPLTVALLAFCGLPWDPAVLDFHHARGTVRTASQWQVRQPLYTRSSGRWRHYAAHLPRLRAALG